MVSNIVKIDGVKYITDENGVVIKNNFVKTPSGNLVYAGADGKIKAGKTFTVDGKKYFAKKTGALVTSAWVKMGNKKYYCNKDGIVTKTKKA